MIVQILPKLYFQKLLKGIEDKGNKIENLEKSFFISIMDPEFPDPLYPDATNYKTIWCWDIEEDIGNYKAITQEQIQELYDFIYQNKDKKTCYVHCSAGISRSGAVGTFINDLFGEPYFEFKKRNPYIHPNGRILRLLHRLERNRGDI